MNLNDYIRRSARDREQASASEILAGCAVTPERALRLRTAIEVAAESFDDNTALEYPELYPTWAAGIHHAAGVRVRHGDKLWRCLQDHVSQNDWTPENAAALWEQINETHAGTADDPIPYEGNMALEQGKYYIQNGAVYLCTRDTVNPVYAALADLVGTYVEIY